MEHKHSSVKGAGRENFEPFRGITLKSFCKMWMSGSHATCGFHGGSLGGDKGVAQASVFCKNSPDDSVMS